MLVSRQEHLLKDLRAHPELSMRAGRNRGQVAQYLTDLGYAVHHIGGGTAGC